MEGETLRWVFGTITAAFLGLTSAIGVLWMRIVRLDDESRKCLAAQATAEAKVEMLERLIENNRSAIAGHIQRCDEKGVSK